MSVSLKTRHTNSQHHYFEMLYWRAHVSLCRETLAFCNFCFFFFYFLLPSRLSLVVTATRLCGLRLGNKTTSNDEMHKMLSENRYTWSAKLCYTFFVFPLSMSLVICTQSSHSSLLRLFASSSSSLLCVSFCPCIRLRHPQLTHIRSCSVQSIRATSRSNRRPHTNTTFMVWWLGGRGWSKWTFRNFSFLLHVRFGVARAHRLSGRLALIVARIEISSSVYIWMITRTVSSMHKAPARPFGAK